MYRMSSWYYNCLSIYSIYSVYTVFWDIPVRLSSPSIKRKVKCRPVNEFKSKKTFREFKDPVNTQLTQASKVTSHTFFYYCSKRYSISCIHIVTLLTFKCQ